MKPFEAPALLKKDPVQRSALARALGLLPQWSFGLLIVAALPFAGCVRFQPQPLSPDVTANQLQSRSLTNLPLKAFLEANAHRDLTNWPSLHWDLELLTLAGFYYHPSLEVARAEWQLASAATKTAAERPNPTVTASAAYEPAADAFSPWIPGLMFDLPIETAGKRRVRTQQARHLSDVAKFRVATAAWQVRSQIRAALVESVAARQRLGLTRHQLDLRQDLADRLDRQFRAGAISALELNTARLAVVRARADMADSERAVAEATPHLAAAVGIPASDLRTADLQFDLAATAGAEQLTSSEARRLALLGRADVLAALADYAATQSALQLEVAKQYPDVHLSPGYSWNAGSAGEHDWQLGATIELPLLNRHRGPIAEAAARRNASAARFLALQATVIAQIDSATASLHASQTNVAVLQSLLGAQEQRRRLVEAQLQAGAIDRLEFIAGELELSAIELGRLDAQIKLQQSVGALEDAVQRPLLLPDSVFESSRTDVLR